MHSAFKTWDHAEESLESIERRIHDGVPISALHSRATSYVETMYSLFPYAVPNKSDVVMEVGSGVAYIMQAVMDRFQPARIIGLDVAPAMIEHAKARLARDGVDASRFEFWAYDGIQVPAQDGTVDHIYSVAALQHVPKLYVYHLFAEMLRLLRGGFAVIHLIAFSHMANHYGKLAPPFIEEVNMQLAGAEGQWMNFYAKEELTAVLAALGAAHVEVVQRDGALWTAFRRR
jgi:ubiquinone/menaquinone biosynthesis C-methylase UbiE